MLGFGSERSRRNVAGTPNRLTPEHTVAHAGREIICPRAFACPFGLPEDSVIEREPVPVCPPEFRSFRGKKYSPARFGSEESAKATVSRSRGVCPDRSRLLRACIAFVDPYSRGYRLGCETRTNRFLGSTAGLLLARFRCANDRERRFRSTRASSGSPSTGTTFSASESPRRFGPSNPSTARKRIPANCRFVEIFTAMAFP